MEEFNTEEKVLQLFKEKGLNAKENCVDVLLKNLAKYSGMVAGMEYPYTGLLINFTEEGIGYFYLNYRKLTLKLQFDKLTLDKDSYNFIKYEDIKSIEVKKFALLDKKKKSVIIKTKDKKTHYLYQFIEDDTFPYHNANFAKIIEKYSVK